MAATTELLRDEPDLAARLPRAALARARRACVAGVTRVARGEWEPRAAPDPGGFGLLVRSGHLVRRVGQGGRTGAELVGPGDLLRPWHGAGLSPSDRLEPRWQAITPAELVVLDQSFARRAAPFPALAEQLVERAMLRSRHLAIVMAIVHQPRVDRRLHRLFWAYADRWGRVDAEGTSVELPLTHALLAELVAARRPTVSSALAQLERGGEVARSGDLWRLWGDPPG